MFRVTLNFPEKESGAFRIIILQYIDIIFSILLQARNGA